MIKLRKVNPEVYFATQFPAVIGPSEIDWLKYQAGRSSRKRCRICLHSDEREDLQETLLVYRQETFNRPNRHPVHESFHVVEGRVDVFFFEVTGELKNWVAIGDKSTGLPFACRFPIMTYHTMIVRSEWLVLHETCHGPFVRGETTLYAPWAPDESDLVGQAQFLNKLEAHVFVDREVR